MAKSPRTHTPPGASPPVAMADRSMKSSSKSKSWRQCVVGRWGLVDSTTGGAVLGVEVGVIVVAVGVVVVVVGVVAVVVVGFAVGVVVGWKNHGAFQSRHEQRGHMGDQGQ